MVWRPLHPTGTVQTFTAPVDGIYQFELWGSPGGNGGGPGGYTKFYMNVTGRDLLYCFVGGSGFSAQGNVTIGGWNGGGAVSTCLAGGHAGSGGGMTHISYTNNPATTYWNPSGTIGCSGGGGGASYVNSHAGAGGGRNGGNGQKDPRYNGGHTPYGATQTSGYRQGVGEPCANSGGGGAGWFGGYSSGQTKQTSGGRCLGTGAGGSGYICPAGEQTSYTPNNLCLVGTDASIPRKPNSGTSLGLHGYIRVLLVSR